MSEVTDLLQQLTDGKITLEELAAKFAQRTWPSSPQLSPTQKLNRAWANETDVETPPNSFEEVRSAWFSHEITDEQYAALKDAVTKDTPAET
jgi:hypothetical protein